MAVLRPGQGSSTEMEFNLADLFEGVVDAVPDRDALYAEGRRLTFRQLDARANRLAHYFLSVGVAPGDHIGCHMMNGTEYLETMLALFKIRAVPVNVNFRYVEDELLYLYKDADLKGVVFDTEFADRVSAVLPRVDAVRHLVAVGPADGYALPEGSVAYDDALAGQSDDRDGFPVRSAGDLFVIYTGGTTGMPKGVMWRHEDIFFAGIGGGYPMGEPLAKPSDAGPRAAANSPMVSFPAPPLMHGAAELGSFINFMGGGKVVLVRRYTGHSALALIEQEKVNTLTIVGDAMALPLVDALAEKEYDVSSLVALASAGAILSQPLRDLIAKRLPNVFVIDSFGSTETGFNGTAAAGSQPSEGLKFAVNERTSVFDDDRKPVQPGSGVVGRVAQRGHIPVGYYGDPVKTAETFVEIDGERWVLLGDMATVEADGSMRFLGRGSICINSGGEKIYPEEVEGALKSHPDLVDAVVAGIPDERWGQRVAAVLQTRPGAAVPTQEEIEQHLASRIARYKVPRFLHAVETMQRSPSGKPDYGWATKVLTEAAAGAPA
ncbi:MAG: 3-oxocholest-4-en-26-oate---CoA ligase [Actinomycetota bacterium]|nr:3-oxocholest-4-en-26-oate---CoA ligase [Actinomycetota bacterium]